MRVQKTELEKGAESAWKIISTPDSCLVLRLKNLFTLHFENILETGTVTNMGIHGGCWDLSAHTGHKGPDSQPVPTNTILRMSDYCDLAKDHCTPVPFPHQVPARAFF